VNANVFPDHFLKTLHLRRHGIYTRWQRRKTIVAILVRVSCSDATNQSRTAGCDGNTWKRRLVGIGNFSQDNSGILLCEDRNHTHKKKEGEGTKQECSKAHRLSPHFRPHIALFSLFLNASPRTYLQSPCYLVLTSRSIDLRRRFDPKESQKIQNFVLRLCANFL